MKFVIGILEDRLSTLNAAYKARVVNGSVDPNGYSALANRANAKEITEAIKLLRINDSSQKSLSDIIDLLPLDNINRVEVIGENGRCYSNWQPKNRVKLSMQDDCRTLKVIIFDRTEISQNNLNDE